MNKNLTLTIKKRSQAGWLIWLLVVLPFLFAALIEGIGLPREIQYILDVVWLFLLVLLTWRAKGKPTIGLLALWSILFLVYTFLTYLPQYQSGFYYLWGVRNNFRFFVAFFAVAALLKTEEVTGYFKLFDVLFWINVVVSLYQYFFMELSGDQLGGIFSTVAGGNGGTNIFFVIVITKDVLFYIEKKERLGNCILKCVAALLVAALAELKFFFAEFVIIVALASLFTRFTWRKLLVIVGGLVAVTAFAALLSTLFPIFEGFFSWDYFLETSVSDKGYTSSGDLNRLTAISEINELWLRNFWQRLFGLGLGNCDTSGFAFLNTPFFATYGDMHYSWLSHAFLYLETGWIGLVFYYGFFALVCFSIHRIEKRSEGLTKTYCRMSRILSILCMIIAVYNSSLRTEAGYMMFFALAVPFALDRENKTKELCNNAEKLAAQAHSERESGF